MQRDVAAQRIASIVSDDGLRTETSAAQRNVELSLLFIDAKRNVADASVTFRRGALEAYLRRTLTEPLPDYFISLDASQPWLCYWILHGLNLLTPESQPPVDSGTSDDIVDFLQRCSHADGGYGGGPGQSPHLATTYAAVNALATIGTEDALESIDRPKLLRYLLRMKKSSGGFGVSADGEVDARGVYCALAVASLCNILTDEVRSGCDKFISQLQTFDGGFGGEAGNECHGGYTFCSLAALCILHDGDLDRIARIVDIRALKRWACLRQMSFEGGFQGRPNKLVDSCYSFWVGALFDMLREPGEPLSFEPYKLREYLLNYCQAPSGGMRDKPGKTADYYHTCYALSGLSLAQQAIFESGDVVDESERLKRINSVHNLTVGCYERTKHYFLAHPVAAPS